MSYSGSHLKIIFQNGSWESLKTFNAAFKIYIKNKKQEFSYCTNLEAIFQQVSIKQESDLTQEGVISSVRIQFHCLKEPFCQVQDPNPVEVIFY